MIPSGPSTIPSAKPNHAGRDLYRATATAQWALSTQSGIGTYQIQGSTVLFLEVK